MKNNNTDIEFNIFPLGDAALTAEFGDEISEELNDRAQMLYLQLKEQKVPGIRDIVPTCGDPLQPHGTACPENGRAHDRRHGRRAFCL